MKRALLLPMLLALVLPAGAQDTPEKDFKEALKAQDEAGLEKACRGLVQFGRVEHARVILGALSKPVPQANLYWILVRAAAAFQNTDPLQAVAKFILENRKLPVTRDLCMALHNNFTPGCEEALCTILAGGSEEMRVSALDHLVDIGRKPAVAAAIELLRKEGDRLPAAVRARSFRLLAVLTGKDFGDSVTNWTGWWDANKDRPWSELRKAGAPADSGGTTTLGQSRQDESERLKTAKVLVLRAGSACKCGHNHDLDEGIDRVLASMPFVTQSITKDKFENDAQVTDDWLKQFIAIIAICTNIRDHCICPTCKKGAPNGMRQFQ